MSLKPVLPGGLVQVPPTISGVLNLKGSTNCSANPNYPSATKGDMYYVSAAGKIGGASGIMVGIGDSYTALADNAGGTQASVGSSWFILVQELPGWGEIDGTLSDQTDLQSALDAKLTTSGSNLTSIAIRNFSDLQNVGAGKTIYVDGVNGNDSTGTRGQQNKPFLTVTAAKAATGITSGDIIRVGPGTFTISDNQLTLNGVTILGSGRGVTTLIGTSVDSLVISLGNNGALQNVTAKVLRLENVQTSGDEVCYILDTEVIGVDDCVLAGQDTGGTLKFNSFNSTFTSSWDTIVGLNNGSVDDGAVVLSFFNSLVTISGHSSSEQAHGINASTGVNVRFFGGAINVDGTANTGLAVGARTAGGTVEIYNARLDVTGPDGFTYDLGNDGGTITISGTGRPDGIALATYGTITDISRYLKRDNNLSDLVSASTARTNLGLGIGTNVQAYDADLTSWAGVTRASGFDTFTATPSSVNLKSLVTDETGSGALVFATSPTFVTPILGTPTSGTLTNCTFPGTTAGGNAAAGNIGEYVSASVVQGSATALTSATPKTVTSISLTAGDWDVTGIGSISGASTGTEFDVAIGTTTNSMTGTVLGDTRCQTPTVSLAGADATLMIPAVRVSISSTTTYYLIVQETFTIGTPAAYGRISARRVR